MRERALGLAYRRYVEQIAGIGTLALFVLWGAYYVPQRLRQRNQLVESRVEDRFSGSLRVLAVAQKNSATGRSAGESECGAGAAKRNQLLTPPMGVVQAGSKRRELEGAVDVDQSKTDQTGSAGHGTSRRPVPVRPSRREQAEAPAVRTLVQNARAAAARRRLILTLGLLVVSAGTWLAMAAGLAIIVPLISTALLGTVLVLGRRAVVAGQRADAAARRGVSHSASTPVRRGRTRPTAAVVGRAVRGNQAHTEMISSAQVGERLATITADAAPEQTTTDADATATQTAEAAPGVQDAGDAGVNVSADAAGVVISESAGVGLSSYAVPRATYMSKDAAPRREPAPLQPEDVTTPATASARAEAERAETARSAEEFGDLKPSPDGLGVDLNQILARRRAAGA